MNRLFKYGVMLSFLATSFLTTSVGATSARVADNPESAK